MSLYNARNTTDGLRITKFDALGNPEASYLTSDQACKCPAGIRPSCRHRAMLPNLRPIADTAWFWDYDRHDVVNLDGMTKATSDHLDAMRAPQVPPTRAEPTSLADAIRAANIPGVQVFSLNEPAQLHNAIAEAVGEPTLPAPTQRMRR